MSRQNTGAQWDYPYGWAPVNLLAIEGLRRYGFAAEANQLTYKFLSMVLENFRRDGTIREKYNVVTRSSETHVAVGYQENVVGFGWTNGVFIALLDSLPKEWKEKLALPSPAPLAGRQPALAAPIASSGLTPAAANWPRTTDASVR